MSRSIKAPHVSIHTDQWRSAALCSEQEHMIIVPEKHPTHLRVKIKKKALKDAACDKHMRSHSFS